jgi:RNA polymerase sigma-70 factor (ECF subfamily)
MNPTELFDHFKRGDPEAFRIVYDLHFSRLFLIIQDHVGQRELAEDIVANAFIKLFERRVKIRELDHIYAFLYVVARNEAISHFRAQRRHRVARVDVARVDEDQLVDTEYHDPREAERESDRWLTKMYQLVDLLPPARRKIFRLHFFDGLSIREIANQLDLNEVTVRNQRNRALIFLRQAFLL